MSSGLFQPPSAVHTIFDKKGPIASQETISNLSGGLFGNPRQMPSEKSNSFMLSSVSTVPSSKDTTIGCIFSQPSVIFPSDRVSGGKLNKAVRYNEPLEVNLLKQKHSTQIKQIQILLDETTVRYENQKQFNVQLQQKLRKQREDYQTRIEEMRLAADLPQKGIKIHQAMFREEHKWNNFYRKSEQLMEITDKLTSQQPTLSTAIKQSIYNFELSLLQPLNEKLEVFSNCVADIIRCEERKGIINLKRLETLKESLRRCLQDESKDHESHGSVLTEEETKRMFLPIEEKIEKQMNSLRQLSGVKGEINDVGQKWAVKEQKKVDQSKEGFSSKKLKLPSIEEKREAQAEEEVCINENDLM